MKTKLFISLLCLPVLLWLTACGQPAEKSLTLAVGGPPAELEVWDKVIADFTKSTGIRVDLIRQTANTDQRRQGLVIALKARQAKPDVFLMDVAWVGQFAASNWLAPLDPFIQSDQFDTSQFVSNIVETADKYQGQLIALPIYIDGGLLYYRKDLLEKAGISPPVTWKDLLLSADTIQREMMRHQDNFYGFVWQGAQYEGLICDFIEFAESNRGGIRIQDHRISLNTPENQQAVKFMRDLIHTYRISPPNTYTTMKEEDCRIAFQEGKALYERNWPYAWPLHQEQGSSVRGKVGIIPLPHFEGGESASCLGGWHAGISVYSKQKEQSWKLTKYLTSYSVQKIFTLKLGWNPGRKDVYNDQDVLIQYPHFKVLKQVFARTISRPNLPYYTQISQILQKHLNAILANQISIESGLTQAEEEAQRIIDRYAQ